MNHDIISELNEIACEWSYEKYAKRETGYTREYWQSYKLAELILTEVTDILSTYRMKAIFLDGFEYNCQHPIYAIKEHFGVE
jgi:hypothetical protein